MSRGFSEYLFLNVFCKFNCDIECIYRYIKIEINWILKLFRLIYFYIIEDDIIYYY